MNDEWWMMKFEGWDMNDKWLTNEQMVDDWSTMSTKCFESQMSHKWDENNSNVFQWERSHLKAQVTDKWRYIWNTESIHGPKSQKPFTTEELVLTSHSPTVKYLAAYLLLTKAGKEAPSKEDVTKVLEAAGAEVDEAKVDSLIESLKGKKVEDVIAEGKEKLSSVAVAAPAASSDDKSGDDAADGDKEEEEEEEDEDDDIEGGMDLFG